MRPVTSIDLATELAESFALPACGVGLEALATLQVAGRTLHPRHRLPRNDQALLGMVSTGYVACGAHAGDAVVMGETIRDLVARGIAIGAHPSFPDMFGFGQHGMALSDRALEDVVLAQLASVAALARRAGGRVSSVKCHGALSVDVSYDERTTQVVARAMYRFDPSVALVCMAGSPGVRVAWDCGIPVVQEAYVDRAYDGKGRLLARTRPDALITDPGRAVGQMLGILLDGQVTADNGTRVPMRADSFCLHGDTPNADAIAAAVAAALTEHGIGVRPCSGTART